MSRRGAEPRPNGAVAPAAPHAPERGRLARLLGPFHVTGVFWFRAHAFGARRSDRFKRLVMPVMTGLFFLLLWRIRRAVTANLAAALGTAGWVERQRRIWRTFYSFAWSQTERYERLFTDAAFVVEARGRAEWDRLSRAAAGLVLVTGHVGNWEMASSVPATEEGTTMHVVREEELDPRAQAWVAERLQARLGGGYRTHFAEDDPFLGLALREALERGEVVALQGDRPRKGGGALEVPLFGRPYALPIGPLVLARQTGVPILPAFVHRLGRRRYEVVFHPPIEVARTADRRADLLGAARRLAGDLEEAIRRTPHQWFVFRELWRS
ncbi:MAG TPA: lysophospholipid acyltransferase family protein [Thermoanaerobaculia bacterium]|nr:lysophospholipid acyltransferase family protein [Thermoanaerobaculia bacterium]